MKKIILSSFVITLAALPALASAATAGLVPSSIAITAGEKVTVAINVNPQGQPIYTAKINVDYSAAFLEAVSFTPSTSGMALTEPGYDAMGNGVVTKTIGFPGGISNQTYFGTITFVALKTGVASVAIGNDSEMLNSTGQNVFSGAPVATMISIANAPVATHSGSSVSSSTSSVSATSTATTSASLSHSQMAAAGAAKTSHIVYYIIGVIVLLLIVIGVAATMRKKNS